MIFFSDKVLLFEAKELERCLGIGSFLVGSVTIKHLNSGVREERSEDGHDDNITEVPRLRHFIELT